MEELVNREHLLRSLLVMGSREGQTLEGKREAKEGLFQA